MPGSMLCHLSESIGARVGDVTTHVVPHHTSPTSPTR
jgi:hypothetical protein